ncbi:hypothetical protein FN846DRAFT_617994 [Sphaerosporella brunnea]|uniref:Uncharacterized protein n=1 Tax=Sphaerosporella brunnea TaxID=1250544 RepID=A0A5J5ECL6_9PEZI|nr:hypothetical protein FN846DRAFT_617994 [Sphaerosporella brunnea]
MHSARVKQKLIKTAWLNKLCPDYRLIAEIPQKDMTFTAPFVSETGGSLPRKVVEGVDNAGNKESDSSASEKESDGLNTSDDSDENTGESDSDAHPPTGGQKNPTKKKRKAKKRGTQSTRAVKKIKAGEETDILRQLAEAREKSNKEKWAYIQQRDNEDRKLAVLKEKNRKEEQARRDALEDRREQRLHAELQLRLR